MRHLRLAVILSVAAFGSLTGQIPDLPTLGRNWTDLGYPKVFYTPRDGLTAGLYYAQIRPPGYRDWFDPQPYRASLAIDGQISTSGSHKLGFYARMPNIIPDWRFTLVAETRRRGIEEIERKYLKELLSRNKGKIQASATSAGITTRQLHKLMKKHGLRKEDFKTFSS